MKYTQKVAILGLCSILALAGCTRKNTPTSATETIQVPQQQTTNTTKESTQVAISEPLYIPEIIQDNNTLSMFQSFLALAQIDIQNDTNWVVFAPADTAFAAIGQESRAELLDNKDALTAILKYHLVPDVKSIDQNTLLTSVLGDEILITQSETGVTVNDSRVIESIMADNGTVYIIDRVLTPPITEELEIVNVEVPLWKTLSPVYTEYSDDQFDLLYKTQPIALFFHAPWDDQSTLLQTELQENIDAFPGGTVILELDFDTEEVLRDEYNITKQATMVLIQTDGAVYDTLILPTKEDIQTFFSGY